MSNGDNIYTFGQTSRALPAAVVDQQWGPIRVSRRGEQFAQGIGKPRYALADEGTYFVAHNITNDAATTLAGHPTPVLVDADATMTKPFIHLMGGQATTSLVRVYLDFIEIEVITAGANGTADSWADQLDTGATRITTATGVETLTTVNPNMQSSTTPVLVCKAGPVVVGAETSASRNLGFGQFRSAIAVTGDKYTFKFGDDQESGENVVATAATHHKVGRPPVILGPNDQYLLALYSPSQSAAGIYKVRMGWWER